MPYSPNFIITPALTQLLMDIEASRQLISKLPITLSVLESLRESARLTSTHYSTQIEGNRLTQEQVGVVLKGGTFPNRKRDELEVRNYFTALEYTDELNKVGSAAIDEKQIKTIHSLVLKGKEKPSDYRDGQNVIKDSQSGGIVYLPPEANDVPILMSELVDWIGVQLDERTLPVPIIAAVAHYQFATIHPYYDGNGRTARLLTNVILHNSGYGLKGVYSLEEYYATNLQEYYKALTIGSSHNYYFGRVEADITNWIEYFCEGMANAFSNVRLKASQAAENTNLREIHSMEMRELDQRQKQVLSLFKSSKFITTKQIASLLQIEQRSALNLCNKWVSANFIIRHGLSNKLRRYELAEKWEKLLI